MVGQVHLCLDLMGTSLLHSSLAWREARSSMISCYHEQEGWEAVLLLQSPKLWSRTLVHTR